MQLSPHCRWQELKDVIRRIPPDGHIRQAYTDNGTGTVFGYITILNKKKAFDAYGISLIQVFPCVREFANGD
jgi:hypothetical protein